MHLCDIMTTVKSSALLTKRIIKIEATYIYPFWRIYSARHGAFMSAMLARAQWLTQKRSCLCSFIWHILCDQWVIFIRGQVWTENWMWRLKNYHQFNVLVHEPIYILSGDEQSSKKNVSSRPSILVFISVQTSVNIINMLESLHIWKMIEDISL
jgi:hypothetical protein